MNIKGKHLNLFDSIFPNFRLKFAMERKTKKLERKKETIEGTGSQTGKTQKRKIEREEERLKAANRDLSMFRVKSMVAIAIVFTALLNTFSSIFEGRVVAKLPFVPISWVHSFSHRNLLGIFLNVLTSCSNHEHYSFFRRRFHRLQFYFFVFALYNDNSPESAKIVGIHA